MFPLLTRTGTPLNLKTSAIAAKSSGYNLNLVGVWRSLVAHLVWDQGVQGSNPCTPTKNNEKSSLRGLFFRV